MAKRKALGRGIDALISDAAEDPARRNARLGVEQLEPLSIGQPRGEPLRDIEELVASVREQGVLQPLWVRKKGHKYEIIAGERRWRAAQKAGVGEVPAIIFKDITNQQALVLALIENLQREDLNPMEEAESYARLQKEFSLTQEEIASKVGKDRSTVANSMRLLDLPKKVKQLVLDGKLSGSHARTLLAFKDDLIIEKTARDIVEKGLTVRELESKVTAKRSKRKVKGKESSSPQIKVVVEKLQRAMGTKVKIVDRNGKGRIEIGYSSMAERERLIEILIAKKRH
ncbi:MAG: ParB/RepB/Spo0J family partition protein [Deltaproteobacteria bacterium]|nr:ParB/RepB/Spo0J family partition protein [Deltaproteobacteria bacterium]